MKPRDFTRLTQDKETTNKYERKLLKIIPPQSTQRKKQLNGLMGSFVVLIILCANVCYSQVPKLGTYGGPREARFTVFGVVGSTRTLAGGTTVEFYTFGECPYTVRWTSATIGYWAQDVVPPSRITNLSALAFADECDKSEIRLTWTAPGNDHLTAPLRTGSRFHIASTTVLADALSGAFWAAKRDVAEIQISTADVKPGDTQTILITVGLAIGVTHYFRIWTRDEEGNWSELSNGATVAAPVVPKTITNLVATTPEKAEREIKLTWTFPGICGVVDLSANSHYKNSARNLYCWCYMEYRFSTDNNPNRTCCSWCSPNLYNDRT